VTDLGATLGAHPARRLHKLAVTLLSAALTIGTIYFVVDAKPKAQLLAWGTVVLFGVITIVVAVIFAKATSQVVTRYERGVGVKLGGKEQRVRFEDITNIATWKMRGKPIVFVVQLREGGEIRIPLDVVDQDTLIAHVIDKPVAAPLPTATAVKTAKSPPAKREPFRIDDLG